MGEKSGKRWKKLVIGPLPLGLSCPPPPQPIMANTTKKVDGTKSGSSSSSSKAGRAAETVDSDQEEVIVRARAQVVKLGNEFKDLNEAAQDGYNRYLAAVTAL